MSRCILVKVCRGPTCGRYCYYEIAEALRVLVDRVEPDGTHYALATKHCFGLCEQYNNVEIDGRVFSQIKPDLVTQLVFDVRDGTAKGGRKETVITDDLLERLF